MNCQYSIVIQWSGEDNLFIVSLPEWGELCHTHGHTYEEAARHGQEVLETLIEMYLEESMPLPEPRKYARSLQQAA